MKTGWEIIETTALGAAVCGGVLRVCWWLGSHIGNVTDSYGHHDPVADILVGLGVIIFSAALLSLSYLIGSGLLAAYRSVTR